MNSNSLIEIGSKVNIILRFKANTTVNGQTYTAGEPYLFLKNVNAAIEYSNQDKTAEAKRTVLANSDIDPRIISIMNVNFSRKLASLLTTYEDSVDDFSSSVFESITADESGDLIIANPMIENSEYFIYDQNFNKIEALSYDNDVTITSSNLNSGEDYLVYYRTPLSGAKFDFIKPSTPYMSMEIQGIGNVDKSSKKIIIYFDKVSLNTVINFNFIEDEIIGAPLEFNIIDNKNNYMFIGD